MALKLAVGPDRRPVWYGDLLGDLAVSGQIEIVDLAEAEAILWADPTDAELLGDALRRAKKASWIQVPWAGVEPFFEAQLIDDSIIWTCGKEVYAPAVAELGVGMALAGLRYLFLSARHEVSAEDVLDDRTMIGSRAVIVGGGGIAAELVRLLAPFEVEVTVVRNQAIEFPGAYRTVTSDQIGAVISDGDVVYLACALTPKTEGWFDRRMFERMSNRAWLVNLGRGKLVVTDDLVCAIDNRQLAGAALDVTEPEPLPSDHPLRNRDNVVITPHVGNTRLMAPQLLIPRIRENIRRRNEGEPLLGVVDPKLGY